MKRKMIMISLFPMMTMTLSCGAIRDQSPTLSQVEENKKQVDQECLLTAPDRAKRVIDRWLKGTGITDQITDLDLAVLVGVIADELDAAEILVCDDQNQK